MELSAVGPVKKGDREKQALYAFNSFQGISCFFFTIFMRD